jgi:branched-chain amino acid transport system permease protein
MPAIWRSRRFLNCPWDIFLVAPLLLSVPLVVSSSFYISALTEILILSIAAMSLDILLGYTGLASFGHAVYFGIGAYTGAFCALYLTTFLPVPLLAGAVVSSCAAVLLSFLAVRAKGVYFIFLTLALAQMVYAVAFKWRWLTGGDDGIPYVPRVSAGGGLSGVLDFGKSNTFYCLVVIVFLLCFWAMRRIVSSPFGSALVGIRENSLRMAAVGYDVKSYMIVASVIAGGFAGLAGALVGQFFQLVSPELLNWQTSATMVIMVVLGGAGSLVGAVLGASVIIILRNIVSTFTERWPMIMAAIFILVVIVGRGGLLGLLQNGISWMRRRS